MEDLRAISGFTNLKSETTEYDALIGNVATQHDLDTEQLAQPAREELARRGM